MSNSTTTTAAWPSTAPSQLPSLLKELFAATPLGLMLAAFRQR
ncbi:MAG: hypothetical protein ACXWC2_12090 [Ramlibacter sp.]